MKRSLELRITLSQRGQISFSIVLWAVWPSFSIFMMIVNVILTFLHILKYFAAYTTDNSLLWSQAERFRWANVLVFYMQLQGIIVSKFIIAQMTCIFVLASYSHFRQEYFEFWRWALSCFLKSVFLCIRMITFIAKIPNTFMNRSFVFQ